MNDYHEMWQQVEARVAELEEALRNLVDKLDTVISAPRYTGPKYAGELKAARKVLDHG